VPQYGFLPLEIIYKERAGDHEDERMSSQYDDGLIGWSNLAYRAPDSVFHWDYDPQDVTRLLGFTQLAAPDYKTTFIPIQKILLLRSDPARTRLKAGQSCDLPGDLGGLRSILKIIEI
jgi:hypothetical protein